MPSSEIDLMSGNHTQRTRLQPSWIASLGSLRATLVDGLTDDLGIGVRADAIDQRDVLLVHVRALCSEARRAGMRAEDMVIRLKRDWHSLAVGDRGPTLAESSALGQAVSMCIEQYYRDS